MYVKRLVFAAALLVATTAVPGHASGFGGYAAGNLNIRSGPSTSFPAVGVLSAGTGLSVHGCLARYTWCDVSASGLRGWVSGAFIQTEYRERRVFVPSNARQVGVPVITFGFQSYWNDHYRDYDFYNDIDRWDEYHWQDDGPPPGWQDDWDYEDDEY